MDETLGSIRASERPSSVRPVANSSHLRWRVPVQRRVQLRGELWVRVPVQRRSQLRGELWPRWAARWSTGQPGWALSAADGPMARCQPLWQPPFSCNMEASAGQCRDSMLWQPPWRGCGPPSPQPRLRRAACAVRASGERRQRGDAGCGGRGEEGGWWDGEEVWVFMASVWYLWRRQGGLRRLQGGY